MPENTTMVNGFRSFRRTVAASLAVVVLAAVVLGPAVAASAATVLTDPLFPQQWGPRVVHAPEAWAAARAGTAPVVALLDTGVDATHPDLIGAVLPGKTFVGGSAAGDPHGHGTAVAGVIAARPLNGVGVAGYCRTCRILPVRVLDERASGTAGVVADGVRWAVDNGASVINLALVMLGTSAELESAISYARNRGVVVVSAAGNSGGTARTYPAALADSIGVVGSDPLDAPYPWADRGDWADLAAPGCALTSQRGGSFAESCGSSIAAPAVAGIIAHARAVFPMATADDIDAALAVSSRALPGIARMGRIDAAGLIRALQARLLSVVATTRVAGASRIETAVELSRLVRSSATDVVVATGDAYADALSASALAGHVDGPVLLTTSSSLHPLVAAEIRRLGSTTAWIVGGSAAVPDDVADALRVLGVGTVHRLAGANRFETAALVARAVGGTRAIVTDASSWSDASAASALAAREQRPILLVDGPAVPLSTREALRDLAVTDIVAVGESSVLDDRALQVIGALGASVRRVAGGAAATTSTRLAELSVASGARVDPLWLATGANWPDALAAGPAAAEQGALLLVVDPRNADHMTSTVDWLTSNSDSADAIVIVGGEASLPSSTTTYFAAAVAA